MRVVAVVLGMWIASGCGGDDGTGPTREPLLTSVPEHLRLVAQNDTVAVLVDERGLVINMIVASDRYGGLVASEAKNSAFRTPTVLLFQAMEDRFDWVFFTFDPRQPRTDTLAGSFGRVKNDVEGLALPLFNLGADWGDTERLGGVVMLATPGSLREGPSLHHLAHQWGQTFLYSDAFYLHWGLTGAGGQLGGWMDGSLEEVEEGVFRGASPDGGPFDPLGRQGNTVPYAPWELYMMGLIPVDSLSPVEVAVDGAVVDVEEGLFRATGILTLTPDEVLTGFLPRRPAWGEAPTDFRAALVVLGTAPLDAATVRAIGDDVEAFSRAGDDGDDVLYNFWEATGGRATLRMDGLDEASAPPG